MAEMESVPHKPGPNCFCTDCGEFRRTKRGNPLYSPHHEGMSSAHLAKAKASASGIERQRIDFELAQRLMAERAKHG